MAKKGEIAATGPALSAEATKQTVVAALQQQHAFIDREFTGLMAIAGKDTGKVEALKRAYLVSYDQYWDAVARTFLENEPRLQDLIKMMRSTQKRIKDQLASVENVASVFQLLASLISTAASLLMLSSM